MVLANLVTLLHKLERQREALPYQERWLAAEPLSSSAHYNAAVLYQSLQQLPAARKHYEQVLELGAAGVSVYSTHLNLGVVCHGLRDLRLRSSTAGQALASKPASEAECAVGLFQHRQCTERTGQTMTRPSPVSIRLSSSIPILPKRTAASCSA